MQIGGVKSWVGGDVALAPPARPSAAPPPARWSASRVAAVEALWGEGFSGPGGAPETLRLVAPMGLNESLTLLLLGGGLGGPAGAIACKYGAWVESFEADEEQAAIAEQRRAVQPALRRIKIGTWRPAAPAFRPHSAHHVLALEALRGAPPAPILAGVAAAMRPRGHIVLTEMVAGGASAAGDGSGHGDREFAAWCRLENRLPELPKEQAVHAELQRQGFDVRVVEDLSDRHVAATLSGWRAAVKTMAAGARPEPAAAAIFVTEAELWLLRIRLMRRFGFRLLRWHAIAAG